MGKKDRKKEKVQHQANEINQVVDDALLVRDFVRGFMTHRWSSRSPYRVRVVMDFCEDTLSNINALAPPDPPGLRKMRRFRTKDDKWMEIPEKLYIHIQRAFKKGVTQRAQEWGECRTELERHHAQLLQDHPNIEKGGLMDSWALPMYDAVKTIEVPFRLFCCANVDHFIIPDEESLGQFDARGFEATLAYLRKNGTARAEGKLRRRRCASCQVCTSITETSFLTCAGCCGPNYCSEECQHNHWLNVHKDTCGRRDEGDATLTVDLDATGPLSRDELAALEALSRRRDRRSGNK